MIDPVLSPELRLSVRSDSHQDLLPVPFDAPKSSGSLQRMGLGQYDESRHVGHIHIIHLHKAWFVYSPIGVAV